MDIETINSTMTVRQSTANNSGGNLSLVAASNKTDTPANSNAPAGAAPAEASQESMAERLESSVSQLNKIVQSVQRDLQFSIDDASGKTVITVLDTQTEEIIRQIPSEEVLALSENIQSLKGVLFSAEV